VHDDRLAGHLWTLAGLGTWAVIGVLPLLEIVRDPSRLAHPAQIVWLLAYAGFGAVLAFGPRALGRLSSSRTAERDELIVSSALATVALVAAPQYPFTAILFILTASHAARVLDLRAGTLWVLVQTAVIATMVSAVYADVALAATQTLAYLGFQLFALLTTLSTRREAEARAALSRQAAELRATQALLAESSRVAERLRISRELHDLLGHHLTALAVNLEVAGHVSEGKARDHVHTSHAIAKLLLADVREVVSSMRGDAELDLAAALAALVRDIPSPIIHLDVPADLGIDDVARAHAIVRCVQEIVTNAVRHAQARNLWIEVAHDDEGLVVRAHDDGRGSPRLRVGSGLTGMRERLESLGGRLEVDAGPRRGFSLVARLPGGVA
jgi:signal transduction histidine kinase